MPMPYRYLFRVSDEVFEALTPIVADKPTQSVPTDLGFFRQDDEREGNNLPIEADRIFVFDPNLTLGEMAKGYRIFASEESLNEVPARRYKIPDQEQDFKTVFLHARILNPGQFDPRIEVWIKTVSNSKQDNEKLSITFDRPEIPLSFSSALLGGLLFVLQNTQRNVPLLICSSSELLARTLVKERELSENNILDSKFPLIKAVVAMLKERVARVQFKKVSDNLAKFLTNIPNLPIEIDTEIDIMFESPGVLLSLGMK
ncbi:hypothetical protein B0H10DRAFT_1937759 [Mycena sp. CBHHK59/15]|nr:hypothetical protein B0H10DRAFT_1937759 [Mycena sp. CBHHK59/15]